MNVRVYAVSLCVLLCGLVYIPESGIRAEDVGEGVVINEVMYDPSSSDSGKEWIELYNNGSCSVNITNWILTDQDGSDDFQFPELVFPPCSYIIVTAAVGNNDTDFSDGVARLFFGKNTSFLTNTGDDVLLKNDTGCGVDYIAFSEGSSIDLPPPELEWSGQNPEIQEAGKTISLHPNGLDLDSGSWWEESDPTPGSTNAHLDDDPPEIVDLIHDPLNPLPWENVTVSASVVDDYSIGSVVLFYNISGNESCDIPMGYDGANYTAAVPGQCKGTVIEYHVQAVDDAGQMRASSDHAYGHMVCPEVVINEFLPDPGSDWDKNGQADYIDEWVELHNPQDVVVNLGNWEVDDSIKGGSSPYVIPFGTLISPGGFLVLFRNTTAIALDNSGDNVTLQDETSAVIDCISYEDSINNTAIGRFPDSTDSWNNFLMPTPGSENIYTVDSLENLSKIKINEFLPGPRLSCPTEWIELVNTGRTPVRLDGCRLDDAIEGGAEAYQIPLNNTIGPGEFLVFYEDRGLNSFGDSVNLISPDGTTVIDSHVYSESSYDTALGRYPDGASTWKNFLWPTPGYSNTCTVDSLKNLSKIKINEFMPAPKSTGSDEWIELYNAGSSTVNLDGCWIDDTLGSGSGPYRFPLNTTIASGGFFFLNRSFGFNNRGDTVNMIYADGVSVIDSFMYDSSEYDVSYGRDADGGAAWCTFSFPTPGIANVPINPPGPAEADIVISRIFYRAGCGYEFLSLHNPGNLTVDVSGWRISDGVSSYSGTVIFPPGTVIGANEEVFIAHSAALFREAMGFYPDYGYGSFMPSICQMISRQEPGLGNLQDEVLLLNEFGHLIDIVVYGDSAYEGKGWSGGPISNAGKGEMLVRNHCYNAQCFQDTNTSSDWRHIRRYQLGQTDLAPETFSFTGSVTLFASPDSSCDAVITEIQKAARSILIGMYQFTHSKIAEILIDQLKNGAEVKVLMEGGPAGGRSEDQKYILQMLHENGGEVRFLVANSTLGSRYRYLHGKFAVIDNSTLVLSSENWKYTGLPVNNTFGNRGWGAVIRDNTTASFFADMFWEDWRSVEYDIIPFTPGHPIYGNASPDHEVYPWTGTGYYEPMFGAETLEGNFRVTPVLSPDTSIQKRGSILGLINSAVDSIYIQQLDIALNWDLEGSPSDNLYLKAAIDAAQRRDVDVRILLSSRYVFPDDPGIDNYDTFLYINDYAANHNITGLLEARLVDCDRLGLSKVHNKGMIVDGNRTLVSSINWNRNSVTRNREVGVIIGSHQVASYFTRIFLWDWNAPPKAYFGEDISAVVGSEVRFAEHSVDPDDNIICYFWYFDDGTNSTERRPVHVFDEPGIYEVTLTVSDGQYTDTHAITVTVLEPEEGETDLPFCFSQALMIIFITIIVIIVVFIRRLKMAFT